MKLFLELNVFNHLLADRLYIFNIAASEASTFCHKLIDFLSGLSRFMRINFLIDCMTDSIKLWNDHSGIADYLLDDVEAFFHLL